MRRTLTIRLLSLQIAPVIGALAIGYFQERFLLIALFVAGLFWTVSIGLSVRDGAILERGGTICEKKKEKRWFWFWVTIHSSMAIMLLAAAIPLSAHE